jgi:mannitol/fructose-specific phosphotransferase system IIA component (Ntr-type)
MDEKFRENLKNAESKEEILNLVKNIEWFICLKI